MSDDRARGFLQHIAANPDDDTPRLIFADWLEEQGDSARAELIRVQIERASLPKWEARQVPLALRESAVLREHGREWKAQLPALKGIKWGDFRRGFVATATFASFTVLKEQAGACWAATPLEAITIRWPGRRQAAESIPPIAGLRELTLVGNVVSYAAIRQLAESPLLSTLRALTLSEAVLGSVRVGTLTASPHLKSLKALRLPHCSIGNTGLNALLRPATLPSLEELDLSDVVSYGRYGEGPIDRSGVEELAAWPGMARLRFLNLSGNAVGRAGLRALLSSQHTAGLKELVLRNNDLTASALQEFEAAQSGLRLDVLDLSDNLLEGPKTASLAKASCLDELKVLELADCEISSAAARRLAKAPFVATLRRLNANFDNLGLQGLQAILDAKPPHLHSLLLAGNSLGDKGVAHLADSPASDVLQALHLGANGLGYRAARALAKTKYLQNLLVLRLNYDRITRRAAEALRASPLGKRLAVLEMGNKGYNRNHPF